MRFGICYSVVLCLLGLSVGSASAELRLFRLPSEDITWKDAQEGPLSASRYFEVIEFERFEEGIGPIKPRQIVAVPEIPEDVEASSLTQDQLDSLLFQFSRHLAESDVVALQDVVSGELTIQAGDILIPQWGDFPRRAEDVKALRLAGIEEVPALINVAESFPRPPAGDKYNKGLNLTPLIIREQSLTGDKLEAELAEVFDGNPFTDFERVDRVGQDVKQVWILYMDLGRFFPVRLVRCYPNPTQPLRLAAYTFYAGIPGTERHIAGLNLDDTKVGNPGFPRFASVGNTFPTFVPEQSVPVNVEDTISVFFDPPRKLRYARLDFQTELDYDLGEIEFFPEGFMPVATYTTKPLELPPATLGRIFWDEEKLGDPAASSVVVRVQTGVNSEPLVLFRVNEFEREVEWKAEGATVIDRRPGSKTLGQMVDLNDPEFNLDAREIFSALFPEEREAIRLTREEYLSLSGNLRRKVEADLEFWSGFQTATNGSLINTPGGRPYFQIEVAFQSSKPDAATIIRNLRFEYSAPQITENIVGEIAPAVDVIAGQDTSFVLALKASLKAENNGFNRVQVFTPARVREVRSVRIGTGADAQDLVEVPADDPQLLPEAGQYKIIYTDDNQFVLALPSIKPDEGGSDSETLVRIEFTGRVIDFRTNFKANAFLDTLGGAEERAFTANGVLVKGSSQDTLAFFLPQAIQGADVVDFDGTEQLTDRNGLAVIADITSQSEELVTNFVVTPNPFTPNGDGINDQMVISYDVQRLLTPRPVLVEIYDLGGRRIRLFERVLTSGGYSQDWDGKDDAGEVVPPGLYLLRIAAEADEGDTAAMQLISVVY